MQGRSSPLRVEVNPWTLDATLHDVMKLRGAYVAAMGTLETNFTELAIRASKHPSYHGVRKSFPSRRPDRLLYLRAVSDVSGPLTAQRAVVLSAVSRFEAGLHLRDMLAHGRMRIITFSGGDATVRLEDYCAAGEVIRFRRDNVQLSTLRARTIKMARLSRAVDRLCGRIGAALPPIEGDYPGTSPLP